jgi:hypothetical protein
MFSEDENVRCAAKCLDRNFCMFVPPFGKEG